MSLSTIESVPDLKVSTVSRSIWRGIFLALLSAGLTALTWPGLPFPWIAWIAFVPLALALRDATPVRALIFAGLFGWGFWFGVIWWVQMPLREILLLSPVAAFLLTLGGCAVLGIPYAISGWLVCIRGAQRNGLFASARNAAIFTVLTVWCPALFGVNIAHSQFENVRALQVLEIGGTPLLLFFILWANWLFVEIIAAFRTNPGSAIKPVAVLCAVAAGLFGYGEIRLRQIHKQMESASGKHWFTVGSVQPNIPVSVPPERQPAPASDRTNDFFSALQQASVLAKKNPEIDLIALPENPDFFVFNTDEKRRTALADMTVAAGKPVILNANLFDARKLVAGKPGIYSVNVFVTSTAFVTNSYRKMKLVPLIENLPGEKQLPWLRKIFPKSLGLVPGEKPVVFDVKPGVRVIPLICYEGTSSSLTRRFVELGGNIVVNLVNDGWFLRTRGAISHMALAPFRAVEFRLPFVRVTNSGIGAYVQPTGEIVPGSRTALYEKTELAFPTFIPEKRSFYAQTGDWFLYLLTFALAGGFVFDGWKWLSRGNTIFRIRQNRGKRRRKIFINNA